MHGEPTLPERCVEVKDAARVRNACAPTPIEETL
jgi:hypothetical protein